VSEIIAEAIDATSEEVETQPAHGVEVVPRPSLAVKPQVEAAELVERLDVIKDAMRTAMQSGIDYGLIPGANKPSLLKPGAEKLGTLFQLDTQPTIHEIWGPGDHLTVRAEVTVFHAPTGLRLGKGEGMASTRESKHAKRYQDRTCPDCKQATIIKGREDYGGGWLCFKKKGGCGAKFKDGDPVIESQTLGMIENPDLPDLWNTVVKMAKKRARIDAILDVTGASAIFTQDLEDNAPPETPAKPAEAAPAPVSDIPTPPVGETPVPQPAPEKVIEGTIEADLPWSPTYTDDPQGRQVDERFAVDLHAECKKYFTNVQQFRDVLARVDIPAPADLGSREKRLAFIKNLTNAQAIAFSRELVLAMKAAEGTLGDC
jgi:hypothetical protein